MIREPFDWRASAASAILRRRGALIALMTWGIVNAVASRSLFDRSP